MSHDHHPRRSERNSARDFDDATTTQPRRPLPRRGRVVAFLVVSVLLIAAAAFAAATLAGPQAAWIVGAVVAVAVMCIATLGRTALLTVASAILPGLGLIGARSRLAKVVGVALPVGLLALVAWAGFSASKDLGAFAGFAVNPTELRTLTVVMIAAGLVWVTLIAGTHLLTRPAGWGIGRRALGALLVSAMSFGVAGSAAVAARYAFDSQKFVTTVFPDEKDVQSTSRPSIDAKEKNPWKNTPRLNIMLLGADSANARDPRNGLRADTIMVASIDTATGATTIIQIPRNVQYTPFPKGSALEQQFPRGFRGEGDPAEWYINALWDKAVIDYPDLLQGQTYPGAEAMKQGVQGITGLKIDYFVLLNIDGVQRLIDAMGGVTVNINERLPIASNTTGKRPTGWLEPGPDQHLGGYDAMWYARSRSTTSDYARMARQSCLVNAIVKQANPKTMLSSYEAIAEASAQMVMTDIPQQVLEPMVSLSLKVKDAKITRLVFSPGKNGYEYARPDFEAMNQAVQDAIAATSGSPTAAPTSTAPATTAAAPPSASPSPTQSPSPEGSSSPEPTLVEGAQGVEDACAYNPV
ncbi:MAG: LCP family protein [Arachnia sp.]